MGNMGEPLVIDPASESENLEDSDDDAIQESVDIQRVGTSGEGLFPPSSAQASFTIASIQQKVRYTGPSSHNYILTRLYSLRHALVDPRLAVWACDQRKIHVLDEH